MDGAFASAGRNREPALASDWNGRRILGIFRSFRSRLRLRRISGRDDLAFPQVDWRGERHQATAAPGRAGLPLQLEFANSSESEPVGNGVSWRTVSVSLSRPWRILGPHLARPDDD